MSPSFITTKEPYEKAPLQYQGTRMCCVGDIGESLVDPFSYSIQTLWEMQILGMNPKEEDWDAWTVNVRAEEFKGKVFQFNPTFLNTSKRFRQMKARVDTICTLPKYVRASFRVRTARGT